jgi:hypothetical protein
MCKYFKKNKFAMPKLERPPDTGTGAEIKWISNGFCARDVAFDSQK